MKKSNIQIFKEITKKRPRALHTLTNRAIKSDADACFHLAFVYFNNLTEKHASHGIKWLKKAVNLNHSQALYSLGILYLKGIFVQQNPEKAHNLITLSSHAGCLNAQAFISTQYLQNPQLTQADIRKKLSEISSENGSPQGLYNMAYCALHGILETANKEKAIQFFKESAEHQFAPAHFALATLYFEKGSPYRDFTQAFSCMLNAAEMGHLKACEKVAHCYYGGIHTAQNLEQALVFYKISNADIPPNLQHWFSRSGDGFNEEICKKVQILKNYHFKIFIEKLHSLPS